MNEIIGISRIGIVGVLSFSFALVCLGIYFLSCAFKNIMEFRKHKSDCCEDHRVETR